MLRRHMTHFRYDTAVELQLLNELYALVRVRFNLFSATAKAIGWRPNKHGKKTRIYDQPRTPYQRVLASGILTDAKTSELANLFSNTNPADLTRRIITIRTRLFSFANDKSNAVTADVSRENPVAVREHPSRAC